MFFISVYFHHLTTKEEKAEMRGQLRFAIIISFALTLTLEWLT